MRRAKYHTKAEDRTFSVNIDTGITSRHHYIILLKGGGYAKFLVKTLGSMLIRRVESLATHEPLLAVALVPSPVMSSWSQRLLRASKSGFFLSSLRNLPTVPSKSVTVDFQRHVTLIFTRDAHAKPCFLREEKRVPVVISSEELEKRLNRLKVSLSHVGELVYYLSKPAFLQRNFHVLTKLSILNVMQRLATDARLCMKDCNESAETEYFNEELESAKLAVENAGVAYSELLEELALTDEGVQLLNEVRKIYSPLVESLRDELRKIRKLKDED